MVWMIYGSTGVVGTSVQCRAKVASWHLPGGQGGSGHKKQGGKRYQHVYRWKSLAIVHGIYVYGICVTFRMHRAHDISCHEYEHKWLEVARGG